MRFSNIISTFVFVVLISHCAGRNQDHISIRIKDNVTLKLSSELIHVDDPDLSHDTCIYNDSLYIYCTLENPIRILTAGSISIDHELIGLDVTGLATPWVDKSDITKEDCLLERHEIGQSDFFYILTVRFRKGGANDYDVTWFIYKGKSIRISIDDVNDIGETTKRR